MMIAPATSTRMSAPNIACSPTDHPRPCSSRRLSRRWQARASDSSLAANRASASAICRLCSSSVATAAATRSTAAAVTTCSARSSSSVSCRPMTPYLLGPWSISGPRQPRACAHSTARLATSGIRRVSSRISIRRSCQRSHIGRRIRLGSFR